MEIWRRHRFNKRAQGRPKLDLSKDSKEVREQGMQTSGVSVVQVEVTTHAKALRLDGAWYARGLCGWSRISEGEGRTEVKEVTVQVA